MPEVTFIVGTLALKVTCWWVLNRRYGELLNKCVHISLRVKV